MTTNRSNWLARVSASGIVAIALAVGMLLGAAPASADISFCPSGSGAGQCAGAQGVAVDRETGRLYVADERNNRVNVFESDGEFVMAFGWGVADGVTAALQRCGPGATPPTAQCFKGISGDGPGQFSRLTRIAVDNDPASPAQHSIYAGSGGFRIQKFDPEGKLVTSFGVEGAAGSRGKGPCQLENELNGGDSIAIGPGGTVHVLDTALIGASESEGFRVRLQRLDPTTGACLGEVVLSEGPRVGTALAVDSSGDSYVFYDRGGQGIRKYNPAGAELFSRETGVQTTALAVDSADNLYAAQALPRLLGGFTYKPIAVYDPAGNQITRFNYIQPEEGNHNGLAPYASAEGDLFVGEEDFLGAGGIAGVKYLSLPDPGPLLAPAGILATNVRSARATLNAEVNPEGKASEVTFEYVPEAEWEASGFTGPGVEQSAPLTTGDGFHLVLASSLVSGLDPETTYRFRAIATNPDGEDTVEGGAFTTLAPLELGAAWSTAVGTTSATLHGEANPLGTASTGYFEYVAEAEWEASGFANATRIPDTLAGEPPLDFGAGEEPVSRSVLVESLTPGTAYRYRFTAENPFSTLSGAALSLTTFARAEAEPCPANEAFRSGPSALLPDCRAYELVSPLDKSNGDITVIGEGQTELPATLNRASTAGTKLAYGSSKPFGDAASGALTSQYVAARSSSGWASHGISPPRERLSLRGISTLDGELKALSPDLCEAWFRTVAEPVLAPGAVAGYANIYRRGDAGCGGATSWQALTTLAPPHRIPTEYRALELQGLSADGQTALYVAPDNLPGTGAPELPAGTVNTHRQLYLQGGGEAAFVCVLPDGSASGDFCQAGSPGESNSRTTTADNALSADGSRAFWTAYSGSAPGAIYLRTNPLQPQSPLAGGKCTKPNRACTIAVSAAAEALSGTFSSRFWAAAEDGSRAIFTTEGIAPAVSDLYEVELEEEPGGALVPKTRLIAHGSAGVLGASEDAAWIYFASEEALTGANAEGRSPQAGEPNLYLEREGELRFVGTVAGEDIGGTTTRPTAISKVPMGRAARVAPDGARAAFMSAASLTGYDNRDAGNGKAAAEVFLYDAEANGGQGGLVCASCNPSGSRPTGRDLIKGGGELWAAAELPGWQNTLYAARNLSEDGSRLYFTSADALALRDTNGVADVYQWEAEGAGGCDAADASFSPQAKGCIELISSGQSGRVSEFTDASPTGNDVFFATLSSLVPQDYGLVDVYDARVGGGLPPPPPEPVQCEGEACQPAPASPQYTAPASARVRGPEDPRAQKPRPRPRACPRGKRRVRRAGRARCVRRGAANRTNRKQRKTRRQSR